MQMRQFRYLVGIADELSFTRAARALNVSQPALSQTIKDLEDDLGVRLFDRSARIVRLTEAGVIAVDHARRALAVTHALRETIDAYRGLKRGRLRLGVTQTFNALYLPAIVSQFIRCHDAVDIEVLELANAEIFDRLASGELSLGVGIGPVAPPLAAYKLYTDSLAFVCARSHAFAALPTIKPRALADQRLALLSHGYTTRASIDAFLQHHGVSPKRVLEFNTFSAIMSAVSDGACVSIVPADASSVSPKLDLYFGRIQPAPPQRTVCLLKGPAGLTTPAAQKFEDIVRAYFRTGAPR
ncbi:LysR substrate-binding domain-containing protein [Methylocapsa palsarum]|uniref:LysR family transcriptional regulator, cyn operon transcriptional activator n=1 Tax=Methylocapsa palsarum TaxID=1612308 RepID=A0A1I3VVF0_9HYPH|nr:LysR substrate-binding domain-containing protein [Methylocapsa palsarum]SFJ99215.1 LysR family transcriptional regulator, cyn operon transcriptional activator [Methylocapsa palsarum]